MLRLSSCAVSLPIELRDLTGVSSSWRLSLYRRGYCSTDYLASFEKDDSYSIVLSLEQPIEPPANVLLFPPAPSLNRKEKHWDLYNQHLLSRPPTYSTMSFLTTTTTTRAALGSRLVALRPAYAAASPFHSSAARSALKESDQSKCDRIFPVHEPTIPS